MILTQIDDGSSYQVSLENLEAVQICCAALFYLGVKETADMCDISDLQDNSLFTIVTDSNRRSVDKNWVKHQLSLPVPDDLGIDITVFPGYQEEIKYEPLLGNAMGAYHGMFALCTKFPSNKTYTLSNESHTQYWSAGQVLDISTYLDFVLGEISASANKTVNRDIADLAKFVRDATSRRSAILLIYED